MKKANTIWLLMVIAMWMGCSKDNNHVTRGIIIKGTISTNGLQKSSSYDGYTLSDASNILVFNSSGSYELFNITDSSFAARALQGTASALVFLGAGNEFIGCLQAGGLNVLPLVSLKNGDQTVIDLSRLTLDGTDVIPMNNPIGNEINLNQEEIERFKQFGAFFKSLSQNLDANADGKPDCTDKKALYISTNYDIYCGMWGLNNTAPQVTDTSNLMINYALRLWGEKGIIPDNPEIILTGPVGAPYNDIEKSYYTLAPDGFITFFRRPAPAPIGYPFGSTFLPFGDGRYNITLDNITYSLMYSQVDAKYFFVFALPTVHTDENNKITSVSVEYKDIRGASIDPENFVYQTMVQMHLEGNQNEQMGTLWESPEAKTNTELYNYIPSRKIDEADLFGINVCYLDLLGNSYNISFRR